MKTLPVIASSAAALLAIAVIGGYALDGIVLFSIGAASVIVGMFASDYSQVPTYNLVPAKPVIQSRQARAGVEFATMATFDSMIG
jgi:hypothetical protein